MKEAVEAFGAYAYILVGAVGVVGLIAAIIEQKTRKPN